LSIVNPAVDICMDPSAESNSMHKSQQAQVTAGTHNK
jgi:hypothetical protein